MVNQIDQNPNQLFNVTDAGNLKPSKWNGAAASGSSVSAALPRTHRADVAIRVALRAVGEPGVVRFLRRPRCRSHRFGAGYLSSLCCSAAAVHTAIDPRESELPSSFCLFRSTPCSVFSSARK